MFLYLGVKHLPNTFQMDSLRYKWLIFILGSLFACQETPDFVVINGAIWKTQNLSTAIYQNGDSIPFISDSVQWSLTKEGAWTYYENNDSLGQIYGKLYNWYAINDVRGICPTGWRVSSQKDWRHLIAATIDPLHPADDLKSQKYWEDPQAPLKNTLKIYALPGGNRRDDGGFNGLLLSSPFWTSEDSAESMALAVYMNTAHSQVGWGFGDKRNGLACRCVKDYDQ